VTWTSTGSSTGGSPERGPRRFYAAAQAGPHAGGFTVFLDGRALHTPGGAPTIAPTQALAALAAQEWAAQGEFLQPQTMPTTRLINVAIDRMAPVREETALKFASYAETDLVLYRAPAPAELAKRQAEGFDPLLDWARGWGLTLTPTTQALAQPQPAAALAAAAGYARGLDDFRLTGLAHGAGLFGSAVIAMALCEQRLDGQAAFVLARIDEDFQAERWGQDAEEAARARLLLAEARALAAYLAALR
jgi:chaperone required for assembly of F1-ATPase